MNEEVVNASDNNLSVDESDGSDDENEYIFLVRKFQILRELHNCNS